jgi:hypothetical protein
MLYIPQWKNPAVSSYKITTKLRVLPWSWGLVHDSAGDLSPPVLPSIEQVFLPFIGLLKMALSGRIVLWQMCCWLTETTFLDHFGFGLKPLTMT